MLLSFIMLMMILIISKAVGTGAPHCIVIMIILIISTAMGTGAPYYNNADSDNLNGRGNRCCLFMLVISMAVAVSVSIQVVLITMINHLRA